MTYKCVIFYWIFAVIIKRSYGVTVFLCWAKFIDGTPFTTGSKIVTPEIYRFSVSDFLKLLLIAIYRRICDDIPYYNWSFYS